MFGCVRSLIHINYIGLLQTTLVAEKEHQQDFPAKYFFSFGVLQIRFLSSGIKKLRIIHLRNFKEFCKCSISRWQYFYWLVRNWLWYMYFKKTGRDIPNYSLDYEQYTHFLKSNLNPYFSESHIGILWLCPVWMSVALWFLFLIY